MYGVIVGYVNEEFLQLVKSLGYEILTSIFIGEKRNPKYFVTRGKLEELKSRAKELSAKKIIIEGILKSSQWYNLEKELGIEVDDKVRLIIDIFADRAKSRDAMLQVEYARLQYEIPHLREIVHQVRVGEHPGWMGGGEYEVADYYEMIRRKMARIRKEIEKIKIHREERRKLRREAGYILVGIAGYTNSGKSTLLKALSGKNVIIEERMFSTLSTRTSRVGKEKILITDTVGFVEDMPPWLIKAFEPTLEEIYNADIVLLLLDGCDPPPILERKMNLVLDIISPKVRGKIVPVINKIDIAENLERKKEMVRVVAEPVLISAKMGEGLEELLTRIKLETGVKRYRVRISPTRKDVLKFIERYGKIERLDAGEELCIEFEFPSNKLQGLKALIGRVSTGNDGGLTEI
ncbi:MAG: GTPase HflX [Thermoplasmata archaeon]|nr:GTPase HflX [Thermoplasmata archaeon]